ncbi:uncharacterized protein LOC134546332 [Bacillus rossius redtenbacheri]|uniref:uncharacterized protein LOC134546332 n=1 Tax=Bacillus rossius redtenbacheri TaxID=93214 RepID=UPI002FDDA73E
MGCGQSKIGSIYPRKSKHKNGKKRGDTEADSEEDAEDADGVPGAAGAAAAAGCEADDKLTGGRPRQVSAGPLLAHTEISSSQVDFFRMLDEKIESGPDYNSSGEEEMERERARIMSLLKEWENASLNSARSRSAPATPVLRKLNLRSQTSGELVSIHAQKLPEPPGVLHQPKSVPYFAPQQQLRDDTCQYHFKEQHQQMARAPGYQQSAREDVYRQGSNRDIPYQVGMDGIYYVLDKDSSYIQKQQQDRENMYQQANNRKISYQPPYMDQAYHIQQSKSGNQSQSNKDVSYQQRSWDRTQQSVRDSYYYQQPREVQCPPVYRELSYQPPAQDGLYQYVNNKDVIYQPTNKESFQQVSINRNVMFQQPRKELVFQQPTSRPNTPSFQVPVQKPIKDALFQQRHQPNQNVTFQHPIRDELVQQHAKVPIPFQQSGVAAFHRPCRDMSNSQDPNKDLPYQHVPRSVPVTQTPRSKESQFQHASKEQLYQQLQRSQAYPQATRNEQFQDSGKDLAFQPTSRASFFQQASADGEFHHGRELVFQDVQRTMFHQQEKAGGQFEQQSNSELVFQQPPMTSVSQQMSREQTTRDEPFQQPQRTQHVSPHPPAAGSRNYQPGTSQHASSVVQYKKSRGAYTELA